MKDWLAWHLAYDDAASSLNQRLARVKAHLADALDRAPDGPVSLVSLCAGQAHDVTGVLPGHRRRDDVRAVLVESHPANVEIARRRARDAGLPQVQVRQADASRVASFADVLPADVLLLCGIFGNVSDNDTRRTVQAAAALCAPGGTVIWTRHRRPPDLTPHMRAWFADSGFDEMAFDELETEFLTGVGAHRLRACPADVTLPAGALFTFGGEQC